MRKTKHIVKRAVLYVLVVVFAGGAPLSLVAADSTPTKSGNYTYDPVTKHWSDNTWRWDSTQGKYVRVVAPPPSSSPAVSPSPSPTASPGSAVQTTTPVADPSNATVAENTNASANTNDNNNVGITNNLDSDASTGSADVTKNTTAGDANTGDASGDTTIVNSVHSTVGSTDGSGTSGIAHFTMNLYGDITGDITIGPAIGNATIDKNTNLSSNTNVNNNDTLVNNQKLSATSGNATVSGNTTGGSAKSGNANTVADVLNLINTVIAANKSFIGTVNIHGNLNGDILVSPDFIPQLLASNAQVVGNYNMPLSTTVNDDQSIVNNVKLNATSGQATVADNTKAGTAKTGTAQTNLTILNLTGHQVDASKSLLVFVNVLGKWVGMIVDAPGATSAALGSGVIHDNTTVSSTNNLNNNAQIVNNLDLSSASGDATVAGNTSAGDATTGNATASANIANISTSEFDLSDWFGILYINVFGTWIGSFGINTSAGTIVPLAGDARPAARAAGAPNVAFGFAPHAGTAMSAGAKNSGSNNSQGGAAPALGIPGNGLSATHPAVSTVPNPMPIENAIPLIMMLVGFGIAGVSGAVSFGRRRLAVAPSSAKANSMFGDIVKSQS